MSMEEIFKSPVGSFVVSGLLFFIQLYTRSTVAEIKKSITEGRAEAKSGILEGKAEAKAEFLAINADMQMIYSRVNGTDSKVTAAVTEITNMKETIKEIKQACRENHR